MIPLTLNLTGFLSYRNPIELNFQTFDLACIAGQNGAGKSSLLDAITWALFGQARKRDESLINAACDAAEVRFTFFYENNTYRIQRTMPRGKTSILEFHLLQDGDLTSGNWKPLTERTQRETQAKIAQTLRLDYDTFVNAAFFLQGKADQFTQQNPSDRKRILSAILGLEVWEKYRQKTADRYRRVENDITSLDARLQDIQVELSEEDTRRAHLVELENDLERVRSARALQESALENIRRTAAVLASQAQLVETLYRRLDLASRQLSEQQDRLAARRAERQKYSENLARLPQVKAAYEAWQQARQALEQWESTAERFREQEKRRQEPLAEITAEKARIKQQLDTLLQQEELMQQVRKEASELEVQLEPAQKKVTGAESRLSQRAKLDCQLQEARQRQADARAENPRLKKEMDELKERIETLEAAEGAVCPVCGQPLNPEERQNLIADLNVQGKDMGDRFRANQKLLKETEASVRSLEADLASMSDAEAQLRNATRSLDQLNNRLDSIKTMDKDWEANDAPRLAGVKRSLAEETYAPEARRRLAEIDAELKATGYDAAAHDTARKAEAEGRQAEGELHEIEKAQAALAPLEREIAGLETQVETHSQEVERQRQEHDQAAAALAAAQSQGPDLRTAERELLAAKEQENRLHMEVGAARQKVLVLDDLKERRKALEGERESKARLSGQLKQLERAFSKDGVPALLIEQALPEIEEKANEILDRLSGGTMSVRFKTLSPYKDKKREDMKETLDIEISDSAGTRDYELYSGGEAFRANFAIRLALSEVLARRAGARLQTLVIDEGFGSQDAMGRQRLIEAINLVRHDFAKVLVITHIDELKDHFPNRIEVEKTEQGSTVRVI